jgi:CRP-like cAMP-binding protein
MSSRTLPSERNRLLRALPLADYRRLLQDLQDVSPAAGSILFDAHESITHVYFPQHCVVSLLTFVADTRGVEVALVGHEGMVGLSVFFGVRTSTRAVLQVADGARRISVPAFRRALARGPALRRIMLRYTHTLLTQMAQSAACIRRHSVEQRCARWLLMAHDRVGADQFALTQEFLSQMLDVQRPSVSLAAQHLHAAGAIRYSRGKITVVNRARLERAACVCYRIVEEDYARTFRSLWHPRKALPRDTPRRGAGPASE